MSFKHLCSIAITPHSINLFDVTFVAYAFFFYHIYRSQLSELHGNMFVEKCEKCGHEYYRRTPVSTMTQKRTGNLCMQKGKRGLTNCRFFIRFYSIFSIFFFLILFDLSIKKRDKEEYSCQ